MNPAEATREIYWNISAHWLVYVLLAPTAVVGSYGLIRKFRLWRAGQPAARFDRPKERFARLLKHALAQQRTARESYAGAFHRMIFYGFIILVIATTVVLIQEDFGLMIMKGWF